MHNVDEIDTSLDQTLKDYFGDEKFYPSDFAK